jgi:hypothetical protein
MNSYRLTMLSVAAILLFAVTGYTAKGKKAPPETTEPATGEEINWQVISSGGTDGASTSYQMKGTLGQPAVGFGSSASYGMSHGYWQEFGTCCNHDGIRGDADGNSSINVADPTFLTDYIFFEGPAPPCFEEGDADGSGSINVADPTFLTDYIFFEGPAPPPCP